VTGRWGFFPLAARFGAGRTRGRWRDTVCETDGSLPFPPTPGVLPFRVPPATRIPADNLARTGRRFAGGVLFAMVGADGRWAASISRRAFPASLLAPRRHPVFCSHGACGRRDRGAVSRHACAGACDGAGLRWRKRVRRWTRGGDILFRPSTTAAAFLLPGAFRVPPQFMDEPFFVGCSCHRAYFVLLFCAGWGYPEHTLWFRLAFRRCGTPVLKEAAFATISVRRTASIWGSSSGRVLVWRVTVSLPSRCGRTVLRYIRAPSRLCIVPSVAVAVAGHSNYLFNSIILSGCGFWFPQVSVGLPSRPCYAIPCLWYV